MNKFPSSDGIYPRIMRDAREEITGTLTEIFVFWRIARRTTWINQEIIGQWAVYSNREISGEDSKGSIYLHLEKQRLKDSQREFVRVRSCLSNMIMVFFKWQRCLLKVWQWVLSIWISVKHLTLLIHSALLNYIQNWLHYRRWQRTVIVIFFWMDIRVMSVCCDIRE